MDEACQGLPDRFQALACSQDMIGWLHFMEGMISKEIVTLQQQHMAVSGSRLSINKWVSGLIIRLLEITHGQWLYRNFVVHDAVSGVLANKQKQQLQIEIEKQQELGDDGLLEEDAYLAEINLESLEESNGERQTYWLLAIQTARKAFALRQARLNANTPVAST